MPGEFSDIGAKEALLAVTGGTLTYAAGNRYIALYTSAQAPSDTNSPAMTEYSATGYARQTVAGSAWTYALNGSSVPELTNTNAITFPAFTAGTGATISYVALTTSATAGAGVILAYWTLDAARTPAANDSLSIAAGALKIACD